MDDGKLVRYQVRGISDSDKQHSIFFIKPHKQYVDVVFFDESEHERLDYVLVQLNDLTRVENVETECTYIETNYTGVMVNVVNVDGKQDVGIIQKHLDSGLYRYYEIFNRSNNLISVNMDLMGN